MPTYIALLRGVNVSGKNLLNMKALVAALEANGFTACKTYIQSGNIVFDSPKKTTAVLEKNIHEMLEKTFQLNVPVLVRSAEFWKQAIADNPFVDQANTDTKSLHITFLSQAPDQTFDNEKLTSQKFKDDYKLIEDRFYLKVHAGYSDSKLGNAFLEKVFKVGATTRNWNTVCKLSELIGF